MDPAIFAEFFAEGNEHLDMLEACLLRLESEPAHKESIDRAFRAVHSIKGAAGFLELPAIEKLTHAAEDLLDLLRQRTVTIDTLLAGVLLRAGDRCRLLLQDANNGVTVPVAAVEPMVSAIREAIQQSTSAAPGTATPAAPVGFQGTTASAAPVGLQGTAAPAAPVAVSTAFAAPEVLLPSAPPPQRPAPSGPVLVGRAPRVPRPVAVPASVGASSPAVVPSAGVPSSSNPVSPGLPASLHPVGKGAGVQPSSSLSSSNPVAQVSGGPSSSSLSSPNPVAQVSGGLSSPRVAAVPSSIPSSTGFPPSASTTPASAPPAFQLAPPVPGAPLEMPSIPGAPPLVGRAARVPRAVTASVEATPPSPPPARSAPPVIGTAATPASVASLGTPPVVAPGTPPVVSPLPLPVAPPVVAPVPSVAVPNPSAGSTIAPSADTAARRRSADTEDKETGTIRVDITLLDDIMNLVGELVVARNRLIQIVGDREDRVLSQASRRVDHLTSDLQGRVMKTRMRPVAMAWGAIPRLVRDVANSTGKMVTVEMHGQDTELDRSLLEVLKDPLSHIIRNSVDHGIETPEKRIAVGKLPMGTLTLKSHHSGGQVHIEVSDDGAGIQVEKVKARAVANGLITRDEAESLTDESLMALIFRPGFSTAEAVTNLSGRGVGMDVVKSSVEKVGGSVDIRSVPGNGTTIRMRLPLTLAIVPALITLVNGHRFCVPQANLIEIVDLMTPASQRQVEWLAGSALLRLRGQLLPLVHLSSMLGMSPVTKDIKGYVVVVEADDLRYGLVVDDIQHTEEIVIKPIGPEIKQALIYSGATVLGDGSVALIFDVAALGRKGRVAMRQAEKEMVRKGQNPEGETMTLLRLEVDGIGLVAVDVRHVVRVDEARAVEVFRHGRESLFRFQNKVLPLHLLHDGNWSQIVVCERDSVQIGLAVQAVMDVVTQPVQLNANLGGPWAAGVAFVLGQPTAILDVKRLNFGRTHEAH